MPVVRHGQRGCEPRCVVADSAKKERLGAVRMLVIGASGGNSLTRHGGGIVLPLLPEDSPCPCDGDGLHAVFDVKLGEQAA
jgi:hypothetical protein